MKTLKQKYYLSGKQFDLTENGVKVREKSIFEEQELEARYSELGLDVGEVKSREGLTNVIIFGSFFILSLILSIETLLKGTDIKLGLLFLGMSIAWITCVFWSVQKYYYNHTILNGGQKTLVLFSNSPSRAVVDEFVEEVRRRVKARLKTELTKFDPDLSFEEQLSDLKYLKRIDVIDEISFEKYRQELKDKHLMK